MKITKKHTITACGVVLCLFVAAAVAETAKDKKIFPDKNIDSVTVIRVNYLGGISKPEVTVAPGSTVIWMNDARASVEIQFEGKQVTMACKSPVHFVVDENGSFLSDRIPQGSVASLCFIEKGEYSYVARKTPSFDIEQIRSNIKEFKGKIIVQ